MARRMIKGATIDVPKKSMGQHLAENIIITVIGCFILHVLLELTRIVFFPFRYLIASDATLQKEEIEKAKKKIEKRERYLDGVRLNESDPLYQYHERFTDHPEKYRNDPDNIHYLQWYIDWSHGEVLDSKMRWTPDVYIDEGLKKTMNPSFVKYIRSQYELHQMATWGNRQVFLNTLRKYFPEVTPAMKSLDADISLLQNRVRVREISTELINEICAMGISKDTAESLFERGLSGTQLRQAAEAVKRGTESGLCGKLAEHLAVNDIPMDSEKAVEADKMLRSGMPMSVADAYLRGLIGLGDVSNLAEFADNMIKAFGDRVLASDEEGNVVFDKTIEYQLDKKIRRNRQAAIDREIN